MSLHYYTKYQNKGLFFFFFFNTLHKHIFQWKMSQNGDMHMQMFKIKIQKNLGYFGCQSLWNMFM